MFNMETLFIKKHPWLSEVFLEDSKGFKIGTFNSVDEAQNWCKDMGYKSKII